MRSSLSLVAVLVVGMLGSASAQAADELWVESSGFASRDDARALIDLLSPELEGGQPEVVRRFVKGAGWQYIVRIDEIDALPQAVALAATVSAAGADASIIERDGRELRVIEQVSADVAPVAPVVASAQETGRSQLPDARGVLRRAVKAHGGSKGGLELLEQAQAVRFSFQRTVTVDDGELVADNSYQRLADAIRLDVEIVAGTGTGSRTVLTPANRAIVATQAGQVDRDPARTREVLARFSPDAVLAIPLGLARDVESAGDWNDVEVTGRETTDQGDLWRVAPAVDAQRDGGLVEAWFDADSGWLRQVRWSGRSGLMSFAFDDYQEVADGVIVPFETVISRAGLMVERVTVDQLELEPILDPLVFDAP